jgi:amylosucrase
MLQPIASRSTMLCNKIFEGFGKDMNSDARLGREHLADCLKRIYHDAAPHLFSRVCTLLDRMTHERAPELKALDASRRADAGWTARSGETVYACYVDRFAGTLDGMIAKLDYLQELGTRWVHPLPLLKARPDNSDGGFAVADYREVEPTLGDMSSLEQLATCMRARNMGLMLDIVCNHTAREHEWAERARRGDQKYRAYYHIMESQAEVDEWSQALIEVFPDTAPGNATFDADIGGWVWTTFYPFQWDLNYANPDVFYEMLEVLLYLANKGVQGFRLDSAPFLWKRKGTTCRNQPEAYAIVAAFRAALEIAAPSVVLLTEAIESPAQVIPFFGTSEKGCDLAYNNGVMTALWAGLADQDAGIVRTMMTASAHRPDHGAWLNYVRCHDDLIWNALADFASDEDLKRWSSFYDGDGFSGGQRFQTAPGGVPSTNGMAAALVGLGRADVDQNLALARLTALYGTIHALDGWPMIYMGDEIALGNDESYLSDPARREEGRWLQRPWMDWIRADAGAAADSPSGTMLKALGQFASASRRLNELNIGGRALPAALSNQAILAFSRADGRLFVCLLNLSATEQEVERPPAWDQLGTDVLTGRVIPTGRIMLKPYELLWWIEGRV